MIRKLAWTVAVALPLLGAWEGGRPLAGAALFAAGLPGAAARVFSDPAQKGAALYAAGRWGEAAAEFSNPDAGAKLAYDRGNALARGKRYVEAIKAYDEAIVFDDENADAKFNRDLVRALAYAAAREPSAGAAAEGADPLQNEGGRAEALREEGKNGGGHSEPKARPGVSAAGTQGRGKVGALEGDDAEASPMSDRGFGSAGAGDGPGRTGDVLAGREALQKSSRLDIGLSGRERRMRETRSIRPNADWLRDMPDDPGLFLKIRLRAQQAARLAAGRGPNPLPGGDSR